MRQIAMAATARCCSKLAPALLLILCLYPNCGGAARDDAHSLCYDFTIVPKPGPGQLWCDVQGQVDGNNSFKYDCKSEKIKPAVHSGMNAELLVSLETQKETLKDVTEDLRKKMLDITSEISTASDPLSLQAKLKCELDASGRTQGYWEFGYDRQTCLHFDTEKENWTLFNSSCTVLSKTLSSDSVLTRTFVAKYKECCSWIQQHWDKLQEPAVLQTVPTNAVFSKSSVITSMNWILIVLFICTAVILLC